MVDFLLPPALGFIMFSLGLTLTAEDFRRVAKRPGAVLAGLAGQIVVVPALAFGMISLWGLETEMAVGLMLVAACPGGVSSGLLTHLARGDTALSITLTAVSSIAALVSLPFIVDLAMGQFLHAGVNVPFPLLKMLRGVFLLTTLPVLLGMGLKAWRPALAERLARPAGKLSTALFLLMVLATFFSQREVLLANLGSIGPAAMSLNLLAIGAGFALAAGAGLTRRDAIAIATECGLHNVGLGLFISLSVLHAPRMSIPCVVYALLMNLGAVGFVFLMRGRGAAPACAAC